MGWALFALAGVLLVVGVVRAVWCWYSAMIHAARLWEDEA